MPHFKMTSTWVTPEAMAGYHAEGLRRATDGWLQDRNRVHPEGILDDVMKVCRAAHSAQRGHADMRARRHCL